MVDTERFYDAIKDADDEIETIKRDGAKLKAKIATLLRTFGTGLSCDIAGAMDHVDDMIADLVSDATEGATRRKGEADDAISNAEYADLMLSRVP